jgi:hypothetical protein
MSTLSYPPLTVEQAVDYLQAHLSFADSFALSTTRKEDLDDLYYSIGAYASDLLGLWSGNEVLLQSCRTVLDNKALDADDASMLIIGLLWERLHNNDEIQSQPVAEILAHQEIAVHEELLMSGAIQSEALINLLDRKGIISKNELLEEMKRIHSTMVKLDNYQK